MSTIDTNQIERNGNAVHSPTPGPWHSAGLRIWGPGDHGPQVANVCYSTRPVRDSAILEPRALTEAEANARLIAAAPELLAALNELLPPEEGWRDGTMDHMPGVKAARLAIAKAEGRAAL